MRERSNNKPRAASFCLLLTAILIASIFQTDVEASPDDPVTRSYERSWHYEIVEENNTYGGRWGGEKDLEIDLLDRPHLIYEAGVGINYTYHDGNEWIIDYVPFSAGSTVEMDLVLDKYNQPHILHYGYEDGLKYSWKTGDEWDQIEVDPSASMPSIQIDENGTVHMAYRKGGLFYSTYGSSVMKSWLIGTGNFYGISLVLDSNGSPRISCSNRSQDGLCYFTKNGPVWNQWTIPEGAGAFTTTKLVLDSLDHPQICYTIRPDDDRVDRVWWTGTSWGHEIVDPRTNSILLEFELDRNDIPHVITDDIFYWSLASGDWEMTEIEISGYQWGPDFLEFDSMNNPHMVAGIDSSKLVYVSYGYENERPVADAGEDFQAEVGEEFDLDGTGSYDDTNISVYIWRVEGVEDISLEGAQPTFSFWAEGEYGIILRVVDTSGNWDEDTVIISVFDTLAPTADAGSDIRVDQHFVVQFDGFGSTDNSPDLNYTWTFEDNGTRILYGVASWYEFNNAGTFEVTLTVTDRSGNTASDGVIVLVNDITSPRIDHFMDRNVLQLSTVTLDGSGCSDNVGITLFNWTVYHGAEILTFEGETVDLVPEDVGDYLVFLIIQDAAGNMNTTEFKIISQDNLPPISIIERKNMVNVTELFFLDGSGSWDNVAIVNWTWEISLGMIVNYSYGEESPMSIWEEGNYSLKLTVRDAVNLTSTSSSWILVANPGDQGDGSSDNERTGTILLLVIASILVILILGVLGLMFIFKRRSNATIPGKDTIIEKVENTPTEREPIESGSIKDDPGMHCYTSDLGSDLLHGDPGSGTGQGPVQDQP